MDDNQVVNLNVGGCLYATTRSTLTRYPDSMLATMFSSKPDRFVRHANEPFVVDRDGAIFRHVLNFLRQAKLFLPENFKEWELLASEADFYQIEALVEAVKEVEAEGVMLNLNVGGCQYTTTRSTLMCYPDSMLATMISGKTPSVRDANGAFVVDRDGPIFRHVLNFLRQGKLFLPGDFKEWELLASEADFYQVEALGKEVKKVKAETYQGERVFVISAVPNVSYTFIGSSSILMGLRSLLDFFIANCSLTQLPVTLSADVQLNFTVKSARASFAKTQIFNEIHALGFRLGKESQIIGQKPKQEEISWTFSRI